MGQRVGVDDYVRALVGDDIQQSPPGQGRQKPARERPCRGVACDQPVLHLEKQAQSLQNHLGSLANERSDHGAGGRERVENRDLRIRVALEDRVTHGPELAGRGPPRCPR